MRCQTPVRIGCLRVVGCSDGSARLAVAFDVLALSVEARNVGVARAAGAEHLLQLGARRPAFTDADSRVAPDWLAAPLSLGAAAAAPEPGGRSPLFVVPPHLDDSAFGCAVLLATPAGCASREKPAA
ncbi:hypothetical protein BGC_44270 [Burkholderia sp. 3C]